MGLENTPPPSPGVEGLDEDDQIYEDEIEEEIDIGEGTLEVNIFYLEAENLLLICVPSFSVVSYFIVSLG